MVLIINIGFSAYVTWKTTLIFMSKCTCVTKNIYWLYIFFYCAFGLIFLVYGFLHAIHIIPGSTVIYLYLSATFFALTILFVIASFHFSEYIKTVKCDCLGQDYEHLLDLMTKLRTAAVITGILAGLGLLIYIYMYGFPKGFKPRDIMKLLRHK